MGTYIIRRLLLMVPTVLLLVLIVVVLIRLIPGSIVDILLEESGAGGAAELDRKMIEDRLGLNDPIYEEYIEYVIGLVRGDLGNSLWDERPVRDAIWGRVPVTMEVALIAIIMSVIISIPVGVISAVRRDTFFDYLLRSISIMGISVPSFAIGTAIVVFPAIWWGWSVSFRYVTFTDDPIKHLTIVIPPAMVLGIQLSASVARMTRAMMLEVLQEDYIRTARAKGLREFKVVLGHALKNALIPVITVLGLQVTFLIGGSVITETIFALPGLGRLLLEAIGSRDYPIVQGIVVVIGTFVIFINLLVDLSYGLLDPRVKAA